jgi:hypothetical protein
VGRQAGHITLPRLRREPRSPSLLLPPGSDHRAGRACKSGMAAAQFSVIANFVGP